MAVNILDPTSLIEAFGLLGILLIVFAETGLLVGFFMPGDSLLFLAGVAASGAVESLAGIQLSLTGLLIGTPIFAIVGAQVGHWLGTTVGQRMFSRPDSRLFKREYVDKAEYYFFKFGPAKAVVLARFIPIVRTFLNPVAGVLEMPARTFFVWNVVGGILWTESVILLGYQLGDSLSGSIDKYMIPGALLIVAISVLPMVFEVLRSRREKKRANATTPD